MNFITIINFFIAMLFSITFHEAAHAYMAKLNGDDTAKKMGRLSLNPLVHIDVMGTIVFPLLGLYFLGGFIGWAKPVPVDLRNLKHKRIGNLLISLAGPAANLILSFLCLLLIVFLTKNFPQLLEKSNFFFPILIILKIMISLNALLAFFNLLPLPPLDGSAVISSLLPEHLGNKFERIIAPYGFFILMMIFFAGGMKFIWFLASSYTSFIESILL